MTRRCAKTTGSLAEAAYGDQPDITARSLVMHLQEVGNALIAELWLLESLLGSEVLDDVLFAAAADPFQTDPLMAVVEYLRDRRANRAGFVLFGLRSFGAVGAGLSQARTGNLVR